MSHDERKVTVRFNRVDHDACAAADGPVEAGDIIETVHLLNALRIWRIWAADELAVEDRLCEYLTTRKACAAPDKQERRNEQRRASLTCHSPAVK
eukprot:10709977-Karenia_brevis.AAC.1